SMVPQAITLAADGDDRRVVQEPVENRRGAGHVSNELAPIFQGAITGHQRAASLVPPHDDLEQRFATAFGQILHAHVINDEKIRFEVLVQDAVLPFECLVLEEVPHDVEDRAVENDMSLLDRLIADRLCEERLASAWRADQEHVLPFADETA